VAEAVKFTPKVVAELSTDDLEGLVAAHPLRGQGYDFDVRLLEGSFVTADAYELGVANGVEVPDTVSEDGSYYPHVPLFAGLHVYTSVGKKGPANKVVTEALDKAGQLLAT